MPAPRLTCLGTPPAGLERQLARRQLLLAPVRDLDALLEACRAAESRAALLCPPLPRCSVAGALAAISGLLARPPVFVLGPRDAELVRTALLHGASDCLFADRPADELAGLVELALDSVEGKPVAGLPAERFGPESLVGTSAAVRRLRDQVERVARSEADTVLVRGESGTGKDLVARLVHARSPRAGHAFVPINCSAIPETLLETELFGHEAGAYTDARVRRQGLLDKAHRGTLFLDEVAEFSIGLQAKLLRFLEDRRFRRLGSTDDVQVDVRVVAGTNADLEAALREGRFRRDLYYRLLVVPITVPPLRERSEDVPVLAEHFLARDASRYHKHFTGFTPEALELLRGHAWPGNIRELKNAIERVVLLEPGPLVTAEMLPTVGSPPDATAPASRRADAPSAATSTDDRPGPSAPTVDGVVPDDLNIERAGLCALLAALQRTGGNPTATGRLLGISRDTVRYRMGKYGVRLVTRAVAGPGGVQESARIAEAGP